MCEPLPTTTTDTTFETGPEGPELED